MVFAFPTRGYPSNVATAAQFLTEGAVYTIAQTIVRNSYTTVFLQEFPGITFNSCLFADLIQ